MRLFFESDDVGLTFTSDAIDAIAELAYHQNVGARGLKSILEKTLTPYMYTLSEIKRQGFKSIEITDGVVRNNEPPNFIE